MSLHQRAKDVFLAALDRPAAERAAFLAEACGDDSALRREAESLLAFHEEDDTSDTRAVPQTAPGTFEPGEVLAGRYRMIARIGRGGMGDVWRADDLVLLTPVALKLIHSTTPEGRARILNEVRLARQITHPAVCRVFDVGEAAGGIFYTMELIEGEDLSALLRRVGRLPSEKVTDIGRQLCAGLSVAHAQGVLHRDLKPANVLIDNEGLVRITDFGIAISRNEAGSHMLTGTPAYMAPEQLARGAPLSERTDVYALGLVLYELLAGRPAFSRSRVSNEPPRPSTLVPNVNPKLERIVMQALAPDPRHRPASAGEMAASLEDVGTHHDTGRAVQAAGRSGLRWWMVWAGLGAAAVVGIVLVASPFFASSGARTLTERDTIVLADFENTTGDSVFDGALKVAFAVALEQSPFLKVFPDEQARETLRLMQRSPDERLTRSIAREIAQREQLKALLAGSIASFGRNYVLSLEAVNAETGDVMGREQAEASSKEQVLSSLGTATLRLRAKLGESLASVKKFDAPLPRATTASLDALHAYSLALYEGREVPRLEAIPHLRRALELDPTFAMAHALMSSVYANTGQTALAPSYSLKAFELRDRVSERERFYISWRYYRDAIQAWDKALELARSWTATYPREAFAFNSLGSALIRFGRFDESVEPFRTAIRLDPRFAPPYGNLSATLIAVNRPDDARALLKQAEERKLSFNGLRRLSYLLAFIQNDSATMERELSSSVGLNETNAAFGWQAHTAAFQGRVQTAHEQFRRGIQLALRGNYNEVAAQLTLEDAETHAAVGQCAEARSEAHAGLALSRDNLALERASRALALCGEPGEAAALSNEVAKRFPEATLSVQVAVPVTAALVAMARGEPARAVQLLEPVRVYDHAPYGEFWPLYVRGLANLQLKNGGAARTEFQNIVDHGGEVPASFQYTLAHLGLARAAAIARDPESARQAYKSLLEIWRDGDPSLQPLKDARIESARLEQ